MSYESGEPDEPTTSREHSRRDLSHRFHSVLRLTAASALLPGAGLTRTRARRTGWVIVAAALAGLALLVVLVLTRGVRNSALDLAARPTLMLWAGIAVVVGGLVWCGSILYTAKVARPQELDRRRSRWLTAWSALLALVVAFVSVQASQVLWTARSTVDSVFAGDPSNGSDVRIAGGDDPWAVTPRVNILLLGSDTRDENDGVRTDSMIVASIDTRTGRTVLVSLPRNLQRVPLAEDSPLRAVYPSGFYGVPSCTADDGECMLNGIWTSADNYAKANPGSYPGVAVPGRNEIRDTIQATTGLEIDHTVVVDFTAFKRLVDAMGGVDVNVKLSGYGSKIPIEGYLNSYGRLVGVKGYFEPGPQHLDGYHALWYARARATDDDFYRQQRQRCVVRAIVKQVNPAGMLAQYAEIADILKQNIYTDIPAADLPAYVELITRVQGAQIGSAVLTPETGIDPGNPDLTTLRSIIDTAINPPAPTSAPAPTDTGVPTDTATSEPDEPTESPTTDPAGTAAPTTSAAPVDECANTPEELAQASADAATGTATVDN